MSWNSELSAFEKTKYFGAISNRLPNNFFGTNVYKTYESCRQSLLTILQWTNTTIISKWGIFSTFLSLIVLFSVLPSNLIVPGVKIAR